MHFWMGLQGTAENQHKIWLWEKSGWKMSPQWSIPTADPPAREVLRVDSAAISASLLELSGVCKVWEGGRTKREALQKKSQAITYPDSCPGGLSMQLQSRIQILWISKAKATFSKILHCSRTALSIDLEFGANERIMLSFPPLITEPKAKEKNSFVYPSVSLMASAFNRLDFHFCFC